MNKKKGNVISRTLKIAARGKAGLSLACALSAVGMAAGMVPYFSVYKIAGLLLTASADASETQSVYLWAAAAGLGILAKMIFSFLGNVGCHRVAFRLLVELRMKITEHLGKLPMGFFDTHTTGDIQKIMDENIEKIETFIAHMLPDIVGSALVLVILFSALLKMSVILAFTVLLCVVVAFVFQMLVFGGKKTRKIMADVAVSHQKVTSAFSEYVKGIAEVKLFGRAGSVTHALEENIESYRKWELVQYKKASPPFTAYKTLTVSMLTFILPVGIIMMMNAPEESTVISVLMALIITPAMYDPLMLCVNYGTQMSMLSVSLDDIAKILETRPIKASKNPKTPTSFDICFTNVSFSYADVSDPLRSMALNNVSFTAGQGKVTALVGSSGGGKTTVGRLLSRFHDVEEGSITVGGVDIRDIDPAFLQEHIATVFQDTWIFADTVRDNITMNRPCAEEDLINAAKAARCHDFIMSLPQGYDTKIGSGGMSLSGGEAQRLSIARAILKNAPIVVLDEALAYSDAEIENQIQLAIKNLLRGKTVLIIAHRLQSIQDADQILVLRDGEIIESGNHDSLMSSDTEYRTLWNLQHEADEWNISFDLPAPERSTNS